MLGFSNRWYPAAIETALTIDLGEYRVRSATPALFIATKLEAFHGRGGGDVVASHEAILAARNCAIAASTTMVVIAISTRAIGVRFAQKAINTTRPAAKHRPSPMVKAKSWRRRTTGRLATKSSAAA